MFKIKTEEYILDFLSGVPFIRRSYSKNEILKNEGDYCNSIGVVLEGKIDIKRMMGSQVVHVATFGIGCLFGEVIAFSDVAYYPATVIAATDCNVIYIMKKDFIKFCMVNEDFLTDFMNSLTNKIIVLNQSITNSTFSSIRQKICNYIIVEYKKQKTLNIKLNITKEMLAEKLGINRPSLSREFMKLKQDGLIDYSRNTIQILNIEEIENQLF